MLPIIPEEVRNLLVALPEPHMAAMRLAIKRAMVAEANDAVLAEQAKWAEERSLLHKQLDNARMDHRRAEYAEQHDTDRLYGPETRQHCDCGRPFCGGRDLAKRCGPHGGASEEAMDIGQAMSSLYVYGAVAYAQHATAADNYNPPRCSGGWLAVGLDIEARVLAERKRCVAAVVAAIPNGEPEACEAMNAALAVIRDG